MPKICYEEKIKAPAQPSESEPRFFLKIEKRGECWVWIGGKNRNGYGIFSISGKSVLAHRNAYAKNDELLRLTAQVGLDVLIEMKSPGCEWLYLFDA